jgi:hypothetical protein
VPIKAIDSFCLKKLTNNVRGMYAHLHPKQIASHSLKAFLQAVQKFVEPRLVPDAAGNPPDLAHIISVRL